MFCQVSSDDWEPADWAELLLPVTSYIKLLVTRYRSVLDDNEAAILLLVNDIQEAMKLLPSGQRQLTPAHRSLNTTCSSLLRYPNISDNVKTLSCVMFEDRCATTS